MNFDKSNTLQELEEFAEYLSRAVDNLAHAKAMHVVDKEYTEKLNDMRGELISWEMNLYYEIKQRNQKLEKEKRYV